MLKWILKKRVGQKWYPIQLYGFPLYTMSTLKLGESHNTEADKHVVQSFYSLEFKNRYVNTNISLYLSKSIGNNH